MKRIKKYIVFLLGMIICLTAVSGTVSAANKTVLKIAIPKTSNHNVQKAVKKYNRDKKEKYLIELIEIKTPNVEPSSYDGLIIPGGTHVHPSFYGQKTLCKKHKYDLSLDKMEIALVRNFMKAKKPILGICRGAQLVNVVLGGTIKADIGKKHYKWAYRKTNTVAKTRMRKLFGKSVKTLHYHHQAVKRLGRQLKVSMKDPDGTIEAFEHKTLPIIGVQFHPEKNYVTKGKEAAGKKFLNYFWGICAGKIKY